MGTLCLSRKSEVQILIEIMLEANNSTNMLPDAIRLGGEGLILPGQELQYTSDTSHT